MISSRLNECRILAVEDEYFLAMDLKRDLAAAGAHVLGPVPSIQKALAIIASELRIDGAVLDINLSGEMSFPVADALMLRRVPFVFTTGYVDGDLGKRYRHIGRCEKPTRFPVLLEALTTAISG